MPPSTSLEHSRTEPPLHRDATVNCHAPKGRSLLFECCPWADQPYPPFLFNYSFTRSTSPCNVDSETASRWIVHSIVAQETFTLPSPAFTSLARGLLPSNFSRLPVTASSVKQRKHSVDDTFSAPTAWTKLYIAICDSNSHILELFDEEVNWRALKRHLTMNTMLVSSTLWILSGSRSATDGVTSCLTTRRDYWWYLHSKQMLLWLLKSRALFTSAQSKASYPSRLLVSTLIVATS